MTIKRSASGGLVYSTETGRMCPDCGRPVADCICRQKTDTAATDGVVRVSRETKGRAGKGVTVIRGLGLDPVALTQLSKQLKARCGSGGTVKDGNIELQGDHGDTVIARLREQGWTVKRAGG
ncbi:MAG: translation initiation factor Sui1 [Betaproteobacteria bacterium]